MDIPFEEIVFEEISHRNENGFGSVIKNHDVKIVGKSKITVEKDSEDGVKIVVKKDEEDNIRELKFICSCGETKSIILDYSG